MGWHYSCIRCGRNVNPGGKTVVLVAVKGETRMLFGFHPEPGNYEIYVPPGVDIEPGSLWSFHCPLCHASLVSQRHRNLCELILDEDGYHKRLLFSRIAGEHATIVVDGSREAIGHGEHIRDYDTTLTITIKKET